MVYRYWTNLKKVLLNPNMSVITINTYTYEQLVFELKGKQGAYFVCRAAIARSQFLSYENRSDLRSVV